MYPQLNLSASLGTQALTTDALFGGSSTVWNIISQITQPLFNPGLSYEKRAALAGFDAAAASYKVVVLDGLRGVADVLVAVDTNAVERIPVALFRNPAKPLLAAIKLFCARLWVAANETTA